MCLRYVTLKYVFVILYEDMRILRHNMYLENMVIMILFPRSVPWEKKSSDVDCNGLVIIMMVIMTIICNIFFSEDVLLILAGIREFDSYPRLKCVMSTIFCSVFAYNLSNVYDPARIIFKGDATNTTNQYEIFKESY